MTDTTPRRSTYLEPSTAELPITPTEPDIVPSPELRQTIAETRAAQVAELRAEIEERDQRIAKLETDLSEAEHLAKTRLAALESMSEELAEVQAALTELHEVEDKADTEADEADARAVSFFTQVEKHLSVYDTGAQAILAEVHRRAPIERAGYIKSLERVADVMQESTDRLRDLHHRSQIADHLSNGL